LYVTYTTWFPLGGPDSRAILTISQPLACSRDDRRITVHLSPIIIIIIIISHTVHSQFMTNTFKSQASLIKCKKKASALFLFYIMEQAHFFILCQYEYSDCLLSVLEECPFQVYGVASLRTRFTTVRRNDSPSIRRDSLIH